MTGHKGLAEPPEGALAGESVPRENELEEHNEAKVEELMGDLKARHPRYRQMSESELRQRALKILTQQV